jgi:Flp pilus assembly protein TadG
MSSTNGRPRRLHGRRNGQALVEFALVAPLFVALLGAVIQFGLIFWAQNTLTQVVRDTGRWAATQPAIPCSSTTQRDNVSAQANAVARNSSLLGFTAFSGPTLYQMGDLTPPDTEVQSYATANSLAVAWVADSDPTTEGCPPKDNQAVYHVIIKINQTVPTFFPGMQFLPGLGTCNSSGCHMTLSSTAQFRMEPVP